MHQQLIECVPNFSEGSDTGKIRKILASIENTLNVSLLHAESGADAGRTVVSFAGTPDAVCRAAFAAVKTASELIDMRLHSGKHPRLGSADVCPLIPLRGVDMQTTVEHARKLAQRVGTELGIPVYCYEQAALLPERKSLAYCRKGEYELLKEKMASQKPDFGPDVFSEKIAKTGASIIGAREILIAVNFNLNTGSKTTAAEIAAEIRESGHGAKLKSVRAIGWYIADFDMAQVSVNITDYRTTPLHKVFEEVSRRAAQRKIAVTGTEIVGLIPEKVLLDAGQYFLAIKGDKPETASKNLLLETAVHKLGLENLTPFIFQDKILEYTLLKSK
jgi:glutamate formiminotransferase/formiminotetrahydrofolate cyclodeaminase